MNFLGVGAQEIVLVVLIAAIVVGPQRFPELAVQVARALKFLRDFANSATSQMRGELGELTKEYEEVRKELRELKQSAQKEIETVVEQVSKEAADAAETLDKEVAAAKASVGKEVTAVTDSMRSATSDGRPPVKPSGQRPAQKRQPAPSSTASVASSDDKSPSRIPDAVRQAWQNSQPIIESSGEASPDKRRAGAGAASPADTLAEKASPVADVAKRPTPDGQANVESGEEAPSERRPTRDPASP